jgi:hypothetical protein
MSENWSYWLVPLLVEGSKWLAAVQRHAYRGERHSQLCCLSGYPGNIVKEVLSTLPRTKRVHGVYAVEKRIMKLMLRDPTQIQELLLTSLPFSANTSFITGRLSFARGILPMCFVTDFIVAGLRGSCTIHV